MNKVILIGRLTKEPTVNYTTGQKPMCVARYSLAVERRFKRDNEPSADFINCVAFGKNGEFVEKYLNKGTKICVTGRIQTGSFKDRDGNTRYTTDVVVEEHEFVESRNAQQNTGPANSFTEHADPVPTGPAQPKPQNANNDFMTIPEGIEEDLPFL